jgi:GNAT superfamily N-acetyltransferase
LYAIAAKNKLQIFQMIVRRIKETDLDQLLLLYEHLHDNDIVPPTDVVEKVWQKIISNDSFIYFVIENNNQIVCSCNLTIIPNLTRGGRSFGLIENVVTHREYKNQGLGKTIINTAIECAKQHNCYKVMLLSNAMRKEAHKFYEALGFSSENKIGYVKKLA